MTTSTLIINESFAATVSRLKASLPQGILLHGDQGVGLHTIAQHLAGGTVVTLQPKDKKGEVDAIGGTISVEQVRDLYEQTRSGGVPVVIIDDAERMSTAAQNAFLKLLEEPSSKLHFILTSHHPDRLLPTIRSRVQAYHVPRITDAQSNLILSSTRLNDTERVQALFLASGRPALLLYLSNQPNKLAAQAAIMNDARQFLSDPSRYNRLKSALQYATSRTDALQLVDATLQIIRHSLYRSPTTQQAATANKLLALRDALEHNASPRLQLVQFVLE